MIEFLRRLVFAFVISLIALALAVVLPRGSLQHISNRGLVPSLDASAIWTLLIVALTAAASASILRKPTLAPLLVFGASAWLMSGPDIFAHAGWMTNVGGVVGRWPNAGESLALTVALLCVAALFLERDHPQLASLFTATTIFEPLIALPASIALLVIAPRARLMTVLALAVAAFVATTILGYAHAADYLSAAFPRSTDALVDAPYGFPHLLIAAGIQPQAALSIGWGWFATALLIGIVVARRFAPADERPAAVLLLPVATAMLGYPLLSDAIRLIALPAALILSPFSWPARIAVALLVLSWNDSLRSAIIPVVAAGVGTAFIAFTRDEVRGRVGWLVFAPLLTLASLAILPRTGLQPAIAAALEWIGLALLFFVRPPKIPEFRFSRLH